ncbi:MAG TPA: signal peptidase II [Clostridiales bacterium UBA8153]|nr:signal peptidase II [Clostridiales bacterium UBA8153]
MWWIAAGVLVMDVASKRWVEARLALGQSVPVIPGLLYLTRLANPGAAFGLFAGATLALVLVAAAVSGFIIFAGQRLAGESRVLRSGLGLQLGGALGNLIDRVRVGMVTDFLDLSFWPVFNVADMAIVGGAGLLVWGYFRATQRT